MGEEQEAGAADPRPLTAEAVEAALLGRTASMVSREVSAEAEVSLARARRLWHALGFQVVDDDAAMFTEADLVALRSVSRLTRDVGLEEDLALGMTRAFARTADRLAVWQTQLVAEAIMDPSEEAGPHEADARAEAALDALGWRVEVVWECELKDQKALADRLGRLLVKNLSQT